MRLCFVCSLSIAAVANPVFGNLCCLQIKMPGLRVITFPQFRAAVQQLAIKRYPDEEGDGAYYKVSSGPVVENEVTSQHGSSCGP